MSNSNDLHDLPIGVKPLTLCKNITSTPKKCHVLLVEPTMTLRSNRERLLREVDYCVTSVRDVREVYDLRLDGPVALAVLNDLLGPFSLRAAAESVRRQWPLAKILIIGTAFLVLEDHLYDETLSHRLEEDGFLKALEVLSMTPHDRSLSGGYAAYRKGCFPLSESDPTKERALPLLQAETARDRSASPARRRAAG